MIYCKRKFFGSVSLDEMSTSLMFHGLVIQLLVKLNVSDSSSDVTFQLTAKG